MRQLQCFILQYDNMRSYTTIKDIANRLGISVSTVSKGLNGANDISEELRQLVLDTAVEMGYSTKRSRKEKESSKGTCSRLL